MQNLTAIVLTKNEEANIAEIVRNLAFCDKVIVIDDFSQDATVATALKEKALVYKRALNGDFAAQRNFGLEKVTTKWAIFIDADERVPEDLRAEILTEIARPQNPVTGYFIGRDDVLWGKKLKFGETANLKFLRLGRRSAGDWRRNVHEVWQIAGRTKTLKGKIVHFPHPTLSEFIDHVNLHSDLDVEAKLKEGKKSSLAKIICMPLAKFGRNWILKMGFLDGTRGFVVALVMSLHSFLSWSKLWMRQREKR